MQLSTPLILDQETDLKLKVWISDQKIFLDRLRAKDEAAFKILYQKYASAVYGIIVRSSCEQNKASMVLESVFLEVWNTISLYDENKIKLFTWINQIATKNINISKVAS
ncbi:RNA polymerase sigma factor [Pedobacter sp. Leaf250]|uniref:RNA polymerase sigma factor n=1 Tax=Pedobacter sp. Leaf250 TaxID=2876559 RepID=UPI001E404ED8|nr:hypothetical protein [Pedobacter sp. Leaf250]